MKKSGWLWVLAVSPMAAGLLMIGAAVRTLIVAPRTDSWPSVAGKITKASYLQRTQSTGNRKSIEHYYPSWEYSYEVDGERYTSDRIRLLTFDQSYETEAEAMARATSLYPVGKEVVVFYDPDAPASAVLLRGTPYDGVIMLFVMGVILTAMGAVVWRIVPQLASSSPASKRAVCRQCQCEFEPDAGGASRELCPECA